MTRYRQTLAVVAAALALALPGEGIAAAKKASKPEPEPFGHFTIGQVQRRLDQPNVHVFDGNPTEIYYENHVPGAVRLNSKDITEKTLPADKDATLIFYCMNLV